MSRPRSISAIARSCPCPNRKEIVRTDYGRLPAKFNAVRMFDRRLPRMVEAQRFPGTSTEIVAVARRWQRSRLEMR